MHSTNGRVRYGTLGLQIRATCTSAEAHCAPGCSWHPLQCLRWPCVVSSQRQVVLCPPPLLLQCGSRLWTSPLTTADPRQAVLGTVAVLPCLRVHPLASGAHAASATAAFLAVLARCLHAQPRLASLPTCPPQIGCSIKHVSQSDGTDLDPGNTKYRPRGEGGAPQVRSCYMQDVVLRRLP